MREITVIEATNEIQVRYIETNHYVVYGKGQQEQFLAEVEGAENYIGLIDWTVEDEFTQE